ETTRNYDVVVAVQGEGGDPVITTEGTVDSATPQLGARVAREFEYGNVLSAKTSEWAAYDNVSDGVHRNCDGFIGVVGSAVDNHAPEFRTGLPGELDDEEVGAVIVEIASCDRIASGVYSYCVTHVVVVRCAVGKELPGVRGWMG